MADAATETTPLVGSSTAALPASSTVGHGSIEVDGARETLTTFGNPTAGEIAWHRAKQFKSLILGLLSGTLIAGLIIIVVIASKRNPNTAFDGEVNNLNKSLNANAASLQLTPEEMAELPEIMTVAGKELGRLQLADAVTQGKVSAEFQRGLRPSSAAAGLENDTDADTDTYVDDVPLSPNDLFVRAKGGLDSASKLPDYSGYVVDTASAIVTKTLGISRQEASLSSTWSSLPALRDSGDAKKVEKCSSEEKFRRIDGSCNNLANPMWGASRTGYRRSLPPAYEDGVSAVRAKASDGSALPLPRLVSRVVHGTDYREETGVNMLFVIWGQFVDHDMEFSVNMPAGIDCCNGTTMNPECIPLYIPPGDHFYDEKNITCLTLVRDTVAPQDKLGPRAQLNGNTGFIDGSLIYGSTDADAKLVRGNGKRGKLEVMKMSDGRHMLPVKSRKACSVAMKPSPVKRCPFGAGDSRVEENMALTGFHTMFIREHNRIAEELAKLNPHWDDERIYQESRRIVIAQIQYITYHEYLPVLMGRNWEQEASQFLESKGHKTARRHGYQEDLDPTVANVFAGAAFRFGHATIQGLARIHQAGKRVSAEENIPFHEIQFNSSRMYSPGQMDGLLKGYSEEESRGRGRFFSAQITNHMFETIDSGFGFDLVAVNIQRGRDRGLPPYNDWREYCGLSRIASFQVEETISDLNASTGCTSNLHSLIYKSVDDVDAFSGMISEFRQKGSMLGPTLQCLIGEQFFRSKHGDRFWFDSKSSPYPLTRDQLAAIKKTSLARLICSGSDEMKSLQPTAMLSPNVNRYNKPVKCSDLRPISVVAWEDYQIKSPFKKE